MALKTFDPQPRPSEATNKPELKLLESEFGEGYTQAGHDGMNHIRKVVSLSWEVLTVEQADALERFMEEHGGTQPFYFTRANGQRIKATCKDWQRSEKTPNTFECTLRQSFLLV
ncbi:phage tail protein [Methylorubrum extorquens]|uniref:phage tail protein n=1 Tax=Methylorubrum extorquens TaxID=408 RepID=UPI00209F1DBF|nr:phage tail protein [Methylorubrum extorquens]MCP1540055.1 phage-related protein [Methylorubrum extorquens]